MDTHAHGQIPLVGVVGEKALPDDDKQGIIKVFDNSRNGIYHPDPKTAMAPRKIPDEQKWYDLTEYQVIAIPFRQIMSGESKGMVVLLRLKLTLSVAVDYSLRSPSPDLLAGRPVVNDSGGSPLHNLISPPLSSPLSSLPLFVISLTHTAQFTPRLAQTPHRLCERRHSMSAHEKQFTSEHECPAAAAPSPVSGNAGPSQQSAASPAAPAAAPAVPEYAHQHPVSLAPCAPMPSRPDISIEPNRDANSDTSRNTKAVLKLKTLKREPDHRRKFKLPGFGNAKTQREKAEREQKEKERVEKEKQEKERQEKERVEKERKGRERERAEKEKEKEVEGNVLDDKSERRRGEGGEGGATKGQGGRHGKLSLGGLHNRNNGTDGEKRGEGEEGEDEDGAFGGGRGRDEVEGRGVLMDDGVDDDCVVASSLEEEGRDDFGDGGRLSTRGSMEGDCGVDDADEIERLERMIEEEEAQVDGLRFDVEEAKIGAMRMADAAEEAREEGREVSKRVKNMQEKVNLVEEEVRKQAKEVARLDALLAKISSDLAVVEAFKESSADKSVGAADVEALEAEAGRCEAALESVKVETDVKRKRVDELEKIMRDVEGKRVKESSERVKVAEGRRKGTMDEARERRAERDRKKTALEARLRVAR